MACQSIFLSSFQPLVPSLAKGKNVPYEWKQEPAHFPVVLFPSHSSMHRPGLGTTVLTPNQLHLPPAKRGGETEELVAEGFLFP